jgi:CDP-glucose 4,6-dehydratase
LKGKHFLITGHTGFKGSWLIAMLHHQGAKVSGIALDPVSGGIFEKAALHELLAHDIRLDIRDSVELKKALQGISPDVVIHLAAQPLVLASYEKPSETYETNVIGTLNVLQAVDASSSVEATLIITTDKVYRQEDGIEKAFVETDAMGAADPYSTSKAMADLMTQSWIVNHPESRIAIARAGNVIGGGDVGENRLIPDLVRAFSQGDMAKVRNPDSVRPWQHVLDCLNGYLGLTKGLLEGEASPGEYNFGPILESPVSVRRVADIGADSWGEGVGWEVEQTQDKKEARYLELNSKKAKTTLGWQNILSHEEAIRWSVEWSKRERSREPARDILYEQINEFFSRQTRLKHE